MSITPKQEVFCQAVASGKTQADAYRAAFNCAKSKPETVIANASRLMADSNISARVADLKAQLSDKALWTREESVKTLREIVVAPGCKASDKTAAIKVLNDMHGYNAPTKTEVSVSGGLVLIPAKNG